MCSYAIVEYIRIKAGKKYLAQGFSEKTLLLNQDIGTDSNIQKNIKRQIG